MIRLQIIYAMFFVGISVQAFPFTSGKGDDSRLAQLSPSDKNSVRSACGAFFFCSDESLKLAQSFVSTKKEFSNLEAIAKPK
jgi:hypothetical protein